VQLPPSPQTPYDVLPTFADHHDRHRHKRARTRDNSNDLQRRGGRDQGRWRYNGRYQIKRQKCSFCPRLSPPLYPPLQWTTQGPSPSTRGLSNPNSGRGLKHQATSNRPHRRPLTPPTPSQRPFAHLHRTYHNGYRSTYFSPHIQPYLLTHCTISGVQKSTYIHTHHPIIGHQYPL
jgi:hypothetical protein